MEKGLNSDVSSNRLRKVPVYAEANGMHLEKASESLDQQ